MTVISATYPSYPHPTSARTFSARSSPFSSRRRDQGYLSVLSLECRPTIRLYNKPFTTTYHNSNHCSIRKSRCVYCCPPRPTDNANRHFALLLLEHSTSKFISRITEVEKISHKEIAECPDEVALVQAAPQTKTQTNNEKIQLPNPQPLQTSKWHQKMLSKLENGTSNERASSPAEHRPAPILNRQLQVQGQSSNCCLRQPSAISRYKPTLSRPPRPTTFTFADPLPDDVPAICNKEGGLSLFEQRIIQLEKMERESIYLERQSKPRLPKNENTTRVPTSLMQPKYLDSTLAFQSKVSPRKQSLTQVVTKSRSQTPSNNRPKENEVNKRVVKTSKVEKPKYYKPPKAALAETTQMRRKNNRRPSSTKVS